MVKMAESGDKESSQLRRRYRDVEVWRNTFSSTAVEMGVPLALLPSLVRSSYFLERKYFNLLLRSSSERSHRKIPANEYS